ncbi:hypothetical protein ANCCAN_23735 [Ancylostoma caninum]|uniref:Uncharacterized protein n=1 Tax=Ancylostoma caninum TaxID=29170 RepID=A0A368FE68_ANCCA|nr:hypothetical protein ANCCAN_23735 [Ancylostoma caninum]
MNASTFEPFRDFVDDPPTYLLVTHLSCIYSVPVFAAAVYCIIYASPPLMGTMKWIQLIQVTWSCALEVYLTIGATPVLYVAIPGGYTRGFLGLLGISTKIQAFVAVLLMHCRNYVRQVYSA